MPESFALVDRIIQSAKHGLGDALQFELEVTKESLQQIQKMNDKTWEYLGDQSWSPVMGDRFYYGQEYFNYPSEEQAKKDKAVLPHLIKVGETENPYDIFLSTLTKLGYPNAEEKAKELSELDPKEAYKQMYNISPETAISLRDTKFRKGGKAGMVSDVFQQIQDETLGGLYMIIHNPKEMLSKKGWEVAEKEYGIPLRDVYAKMSEENKTHINLDAADTGVENAVFMGFVKGTPFLNDFVDFKGSGVLKVNHQPGLMVAQGMGSLLSLILQLLATTKLMGKATTPLKMKIFERLGMGKLNVGNYSRLYKAGISLISSLVGGLEMGTSYASLTALQTAIKNSSEGKRFDTNDLDRVVKSGMLGTFMGGISTYWARQNGWIPPLRKAAEEIEQSMVASIYTMSEMLEEQGDLSGEDMWEAMLWEMIEMPAENLLPVFLGMTNVGSLLGFEGQAFKAEGEAVTAKMRLLKARYPSLTDNELYPLAKETLAMEIKKTKEQKGKDLNYIDKKRVFDKAERDAMNTRLPEFIRNPEAYNRIWKDVAEKPTLRKIYLALSEEGVKFEENPKEAKEKIASHLKKFYTKETKFVDDFDFRVSQLFETLKVMEGSEVKKADTEKISELRDKIKNRAQRYVGIMKEEGGEEIRTAGKPLYMTQIIRGKGKGAEIERAPKKIRRKATPDRIIRKWAQDQFGYYLKPEELYDYEVAMMLDEMDYLDQISPEATTNRLKRYIGESKNLTELGENMFDAVRPMLGNMQEIGEWDNYMAVRNGYTSMLNEKKAFRNDLVNITRKHLGRRLSYDRPFRILTYSLFEGMDAETTQKLLAENGYKNYDINKIKDFQEEMHSYITSDLNSKYLEKDSENNIIGNDWGMIQGLRLGMNIPESVTIKNYFPYIMEIASGKDPDKMIGKIKNPHERISYYQTHPEEIGFKDWIKRAESGWTGLDRYLNHGLRSKHLSAPLERFVESVNKKDLPRSMLNVIDRWVKDLRGRTLSGDQEMFNLVKHHLNKLPGINIDDAGARRVINTALSFLYAGGLGLKVSAAMKNALQGPMELPPGMTFPWWLAGMVQEMTSKEARNDLFVNGIFKSLGVPVLSQEFTTTAANLLKSTMFMFTFVDHFMNRGPVYLGAKMQLKHYINRLGPMEGMRRIGGRQHPEVARAWMSIAEEAEGALEKFNQTKDLNAKRTYDRLVNKLADEYGFLQQANSNWEYGKLGRPSIFGTAKGQVAGQFLTWPAWYWGHYLPSLKRDMGLFGYMRHISRGLLLIWMFDRMLGMNIKPWVLAGALPVRPYGPIPQMAFNFFEYVNAKQYGMPEWETEAMDNLKRSMWVTVPGMYGITDFMKLHNDLTREIPYADDRTGILHYGNTKGAISDFLGVSNKYKAERTFLELLRQGNYEAARGIGQEWQIERNWKGSYRTKKLKGVSGIKGIKKL